MSEISGETPFNERPLADQFETIFDRIMTRDVFGPQNVPPLPEHMHARYIMDRENGIEVVLAVNWKTKERTDVLRAIPDTPGEQLIGIGYDDTPGVLYKVRSSLLLDRMYTLTTSIGDEHIAAMLNYEVFPDKMHLWFVDEDETLVVQRAEEADDIDRVAETVRVAMDIASLVIDIDWDPAKLGAENN